MTKTASRTHTSAMASRAQATEKPGTSCSIAIPPASGPSAVRVQASMVRSLASVYR